MSGSDSYTAEFFKFLFVDVGSFIVRSINCRFSKGEMSVTKSQGISTCVPKEGKNKTFKQLGANYSTENSAQDRVIIYCRKIKNCITPIDKCRPERIFNRKIY